ncbi:MAG TPA: hypothetical protein DCP90_08105 [Clostridiales bacterium]|nr:MAG: hypothetical protein A2Y22_00125 [Clostridiales bacterium GWD2_32_59]HAN10554.1 hypothetical protein [Clostridiales bacterium]
MDRNLIQATLEKIEETIKGRKLLSLEDVANYVGVSTVVVEKLISSGKLDSMSVGNDTLVRSLDLAVFLCGGDKINEEKMPKSLASSGNQRYNGYPQGNIYGEVYMMPKKEKGEGSVYFDKKKNIWCIALSNGTNEEGKRNRKVIQAGSSRKEAEKKLKQLIKEKEAMKDKASVKKYVNKNMSVREFLNKVLEARAKIKKPRSVMCYILAGRHIEADMGNECISEIDKESCQEFLYKFTNKKHKNGFYAQSVIHKLYNLLQIMIREAEEQELLLKDFSKKIKEPKSNKLKEDPYKALTEQEIEEVLEVVKDSKILNALVRIHIDTGVRPGESIAIRFSDINFKNKTVDINKAISYEHDIDIENKCESKRRVIVKGLKNETEKNVNIVHRTLVMQDSTIDAILDWKKEIESNSKMVENKRKNKTTDYIFTGLDGKLKQGEHYSQKYKDYIRKNGLVDKQYNFYKFRHTFCTNLIKSGVDPKTAALMMGDTDLTMVMTIYNNVNGEDVTNASREYISKKAGGSRGKKVA